MNWTQPICERCWQDEFHPKQPVRVQNAPVEFCCHCGEQTEAGIYVRVDPRTVKYPTGD